ncbi:MAG TPA: hypothetical protein VHN80_05990 [Kineosporiaceae bacterium]|nr:hypothetical protein [Kineosporiaceae bacterium]
MVRRSDRPGSRLRRGVLAGVTVLALGAAVTTGWAWWTGSIGGVPIRPHCTATALGSTAELDPEQAGNAAVIASVAVRRGLPGRAATIGIATALQESKLYNVSGGDRDSIGLFQQRPSQGWGTVAQVHDPVYASNAFYDVLVKIEGYQNLPITKAAQKVQRSAFPAAYAEHEPEARLWASTLSGYSPGGLSCVLDTLPTSPAASPGPDGFTSRARTVAAAVEAEAGRTGTPVAGSDGKRLRFAIAGSDSTRLSWSLAQWAVARADGLGVTAVEVGGKHWRRDSSVDGWTGYDHGPPAGTVVLDVG